MQGIASTALYVAAVRAKESERPDAVFRDPFARAFAGAEGFEILRAAEASHGGAPTIPIRTHFLDARLLAATREHDLTQVVSLAAGLDSRAWRLEWPASVQLFELDQPEMLAHKHAVLASLDPQPELRCERHAVPVDLREDWLAALRAAGFDPNRPTLWLVEGLLLYLDEPAVTQLFDRLNRVSTTGSRCLFDLMGRLLLESSFMLPALTFAASLGAPWIFGTNDPCSLLGPHGWDTTAHELGDVGTKLGRWPFPVPPPEAKDAPRSWLIEATKR